DIAELLRSKPARALGSLTALATVLKGLPLAYDRDLQEDKASVFAAVDDIIGALEATALVVKHLEFDRERLAQAASDPGLLATDVGNTNVTVALFEGETLVADWRVTSHRERTADEMAVELGQLFALRGMKFDVVTGVVISSVVPNLNSALIEASRRYLRCE